MTWVCRAFTAYMGSTPLKKLVVLLFLLLTHMRQDPICATGESGIGWQCKCSFTSGTIFEEFDTFSLWTLNVLPCNALIEYQHHLPWIWLLFLLYSTKKCNLITKTVLTTGAFLNLSFTYFPTSIKRISEY